MCHSIMTSASSNGPITFTPGTRAAFSEYLHENPNGRRVSRRDWEVTVEWLTDPSKRPSSQQEFSRRNYVRKTFTWDESTRCLLATAKSDGGDKGRVVVTEDMIAEVVEAVHGENDHAGWDATWKTLSASYYGVLRADLIFLLRRCQICAQMPIKRPKDPANRAAQDATP